MTRQRLAAISLLATAAFFTAAQPALAQSPWTPVATLKPESNVRVELYSGAVIDGRAVETTADAITVSNRDGKHQISRSEVKRVKVPDFSKRVMYGAIGMASGALVTLAACPSCANEGHSMNGGRAILMSAGALLALIPRHTAIYNGPRR